MKNDLMSILNNMNPSIDPPTPPTPSTPTPSPTESPEKVGMILGYIGVLLLGLYYLYHNPDLT